MPQNSVHGFAAEPIGSGVESREATYSPCFYFCTGSDKHTDGFGVVALCRVYIVEGQGSVMSAAFASALFPPNRAPMISPRPHSRYHELNGRGLESRSPQQQLRGREERPYDPCRLPWTVVSSGHWPTPLCQPLRALTATPSSFPRGVQRCEEEFDRWHPWW